MLAVLIAHCCLMVSIFTPTKRGLKFIAEVRKTDCYSLWSQVSTFAPTKRGLKVGKAVRIYEPFEPRLIYYHALANRLVADIENGVQ